jgi:FKBP-type peptidyl-prolyl cis-trans isomerase SlyD
MKIKQDTVVTFHYRLFNTEGELIENSYDGDPNLYLHGHNNVMPGLEQALTDKQTGDSFQVTLEPHLAYGILQEGKQQKNLKPGKIIRVNTDNGAKTATVVKVGKFNVDVDFNHPLAGKTVTFDIEVVDVREAAADEIEHGHAHGIGGHQH